MSSYPKGLSRNQEKLGFRDLSLPVHLLQSQDRHVWEFGLHTAQRRPMSSITGWTPETVCTGVEILLGPKHRHRGHTRPYTPGKAGKQNHLRQHGRVATAPRPEHILGIFKILSLLCPPLSEPQFPYHRAQNLTRSPPVGANRGGRGVGVVGHLCTWPSGRCSLFIGRPAALWALRSSPEQTWTIVQ